MTTLNKFVPMKYLGGTILALLAPAAKKPLLLLAVLLAGASAPASLLRADTVLFSNVSATVPEGSGLIQGAASGYLADAFAFSPTTTATFADALIDIWTLTSNGPDSSVTASIYSNSLGDTPGTLLAQLDTATAPSYSSFPFLPFSSNDTSFTQISGPALTLVAGTEYWLVLTPGDANSVSLYAYGNGATVDVPEATQFGEGGGWSSAAPANVELEIDGTVSGVPEPASFVLIASGLMLCAVRQFVARRRSALS
jgi:hypothetical protein